MAKYKARAIRSTCTLFNGFVDFACLSGVSREGENEGSDKYSEREKYWIAFRETVSQTDTHMC